MKKNNTNPLRPNVRMTPKVSPRKGAVIDRNIPRKNKNTGRASHALPVWSA